MLCQFRTNAGNINSLNSFLRPPDSIIYGTEHALPNVNSNFFFRPPGSFIFGAQSVLSIPNYCPRKGNIKRKGPKCELPELKTRPNTGPVLAAKSWSMLLGPMLSQYWHRTLEFQICQASVKAWPINGTLLGRESVLLRPEYWQPVTGK